MRKIFFIGIAFICIFSIQTVSTQAASSALAQRYSNHWANQNLQDGIIGNWMYHISDDVDIDSDITKAEYLIMLEKAIGLTPGSATAEILATHATNQNPIVFIDITNHPVYSEGWLKVATDFGIVISAEYQDRLFGPDAPILRREAIMMATRALGGQYAASSYTEGSKLFVDWDSLPEWVKGFANELVNFDILKGYPEGTVQLDNNLTYAEAAALVDRTVKEMFQGVDENIKILKTIDGGTEKIEAALPVPAQIINDILFVPLRAVYGNTASGMTYFTWDPIEQKFKFTLSFIQNTMYAGDNQIAMHDTNRGTNRFPAQLISRSRILSGELMVPVKTEVSQGLALPYADLISWNPNQKNLTINLITPIYQVPSS